MVKKALGKGLGALLENDDNNELIKEININQIEPNTDQPRKNFDDKKIEKLSESIKKHGVIQPIVVKLMENDFYQIIAGERRWRASRKAGVKKIPAIVKDYSKNEILEIALIENIQREDLNPIEESQAYKRLIEEYSLTQEDISKRVGKSRSAIANSLRLLNLDESVKNYLIEGKLSIGHARSLLAVENKEYQLEIADRIINEKLTVRETEKLIKKISRNNVQKKKKNNNNYSQEYKHIEEDLSERLGTKVNIKNKKNKGIIEIEYYSIEDMDRILKILNK